MNTAGIKPDDIVLCDDRGWKFLAQVQTSARVHPTLGQKVLEVKSLPGRGQPRVHTTFVTPRQITDHWRKARRRKGATKK